MIPVVIDRPYQFVPPKPGTFWLRCVQPFLPWWLKRSWGIHQIEFRGGERLADAFRAGQSVLLAPNHARPCDPFVIGLLPLRLGRPCHFVAAWHVFVNSGRLNAWVLPRVGAFSIHRWGMDRESLKASIQILAEGRRPLMLFPEGMITRANDRLGPLLDGTAFIARSAARRRTDDAKGPVAVMPVAIRYLFGGDLRRSVEPVLEQIERRIGWQPQGNKPLTDRIQKLGDGLLSLKEVEYLGRVQAGSVRGRLRSLIEAMLNPMEVEWFRSGQSGPVVERVKKLRTAVLPKILEDQLASPERERLWRQIADCYLAQQLDCYPEDYFAAPLSQDRVLETVERFEEDLTDRARIHGPLKAVVQFDEAIPVDPGGGRSGDDALTAQLETRLRTMLAELQTECSPYVERP